MNASEPMVIHSQRKKADLASVIGAAILGVGLGALTARYVDLGPAGVALVVGIVLHAWGMLERHRLDTATPRVWWAEALYWACWLGILVVIAGIAFVRG